MADPISIIGAVGAIAGIIDVACRAISNIRAYHSKHNYEDSMVMLDMLSQLGAFKASLACVRDLLGSCSTDEADRLYSAELETTLECCETLVLKVDSIILDLGISPEVDFGEASQFNERRKELFKLQGMIDRQTTVLTLLLTANSMHSSQDQQNLLTNSYTRRLLEDMVKDSASLRAQYDTASVHTQYTDDMSRMSTEFQFDAILMQSPPYRVSIRDAFRRSISGKLKGSGLASNASIRTVRTSRSTRSKSEASAAVPPPSSTLIPSSTASTLVSHAEEATPGLPVSPASRRQNSVPNIPRRGSATPSWPLMAFTWDATRAFSD